MVREKEDTAILLVAEKISNLHEDMTDLKLSMKASMEKITEAVTKLVQVEERQNNMTTNYERVVTQFEKLEERVDALEKEQPMQKNTAKWVLRAVWAAAAAAAGFVARSVGLI